MKDAEQKLNSESFETLPMGPPENTEPTGLGTLRDSKPREVDGWHFKAHTMPPGLRMELVAAELPEVPEAELYRPHEGDASATTERLPEASRHGKRRRTLVLLTATLGVAALAVVAGLTLADDGARKVDAKAVTEPAPLGSPLKRTAPVTAPAKTAGIPAAQRSLDAAPPRTERTPHKSETAPSRATGSTQRSPRPAQATRLSPAREHGSVIPAPPDDVARPEPVAPAAAEPSHDTEKSWIQVRD
jgi:hypothetical protein